jgi:hypothetical protein
MASTVVSAQRRAALLHQASVANTVVIHPACSASVTLRKQLMLLHVCKYQVSTQLILYNVSPRDIAVAVTYQF